MAVFGGYRIRKKWVVKKFWLGNCCLNLEGFLEKALKIKSALKSTGKSLKSLEKSLNSTIVDGDRNQHQI